MDVLGRNVNDADEVTVSIVDAGTVGGSSGGSPFTGRDVDGLLGWIVGLLGLGTALLSGSRSRAVGR
jgi:hypothetical protein